MHREPKLARRLLDRFEPVHGVTYFAPEVREALDGLGYKGYWMGYFATRSAPLGQVAPEVVTAIFYNFAPTRVAKALPAAWQIAGPEEALRVRLDTAVGVLRRYGLEADENVSTAAELLSRVARNAPLCGRPLFAANSALPWPQDPLGALWHATTLLREHRGATHHPGLSAAGVAGPGNKRAAFRVGGDRARLHRPHPRLRRRGMAVARAESGLAGPVGRRRIVD